MNFRGTCLYGTLLDFYQLLHPFFIYSLNFFLHVQESAKTKHPQLHYESKLYMYLQGGGNNFVIYVAFVQMSIYSTTTFILKLVFPI